MSVFISLVNFAGENISRISTSNYALHFVIALIPCKSIKMTSGLVYIQYLQISYAKWWLPKIPIFEYCFIDSIISFTRRIIIHKNKVEKKKIMRIYMRFARRTAPILSARVFLILYCAFQVIDLPSVPSTIY
jgi:hypothetical protein